MRRGPAAKRAELGAGEVRRSLDRLCQIEYPARCPGTAPRMCQGSRIACPYFEKEVEMSKWISLWRPAANRESGQGLVEYALIIALVAIVVIAALVLIGGNITNAFNSIGQSIGGS